MTCKVTNFFSISAFAEAFIHCYKEGMKRGRHWRTTTNALIHRVLRVIII